MVIKEEQEFEIFKHPNELGIYLCRAALTGEYLFVVERNLGERTDNILHAPLYTLEKKEALRVAHQILNEVVKKGSHELPAHEMYEALLDPEKRELDENRLLNPHHVERIMQKLANDLRCWTSSLSAAA